MTVGSVGIYVIRHAVMQTEYQLHACAVCNTFEPLKRLRLVGPKHYCTTKPGTSNLTMHVTASYVSCAHEDALWDCFASRGCATTCKALRNKRLPHSDTPCGYDHRSAHILCSQSFSCPPVWSKFGCNGNFVTMIN